MTESNKRGEAESAISLRTLPTRVRLAILGALLAICASFVSCKPKNLNLVNSQAMGAVKRVSLAGFYYTNHVVYVGADEGDLETSKAAATALENRDYAGVLQKTIARRAFEQVGELDGADKLGPTYVAVLKDPLSSDASILANIATQAKTDGLLWIGREYRVRSVAGFKGEGHATWIGEISSHMYVFDKTGHLVLRVDWVDESRSKHEGSTISGDEVGQLLLSAVDRATDTTANILAQATSGNGLPAGLHSEERAESNEKKSDFYYEMGVAARGAALILLAIIATSCLRSDSWKAKGVSVVLLGLVLYLLAGRGWWKDTVLTILDFIKEAIFG